MLVEERPGVKSRKVLKASNHLLRALLGALVSFRPKESRSVPPQMWHDPTWRRSHYRSWGHVVSLTDVAIEWRGPSKECLQWAADLEARYLAGPMNLLRNFVKQEEERSAGKSPGSDRAAAEGFAGSRDTNSPCSTASPDTKQGIDARTCKPTGGAEGQGKESAAIKNGRFPPSPLVISPEILSTTPPVAAGASEGNNRPISANEATTAVVHIRMILQGLSCVQASWGDDDDAMHEAREGGGLDGDEWEGDHCTFKAAHKSITEDGVADLVVLPAASNGAAPTRRDVAELLNTVTHTVLRKRGEDVKLLQAICDPVAVCLCLLSPSFCSSLSAGPPAFVHDCFCTYSLLFFNESAAFVRLI